TAAFATAPSGVMQERTARPSMCTVHAPHMPMPQPNFVPLSPISSRMTHRSGVSSATLTETGRSLSLKVVMITRLQTEFSLWRAVFPGDGRHFALDVRPGWKFCACAPQICGQPCNVGVAECLGEARHHHAGHTVPDTDSVKNNTNKVGRFRQGQRGIECKLRPDLERCSTVVVTGTASGNVKTRIWIWLLSNPEIRRAHCLGDD